MSAADQIFNSAWSGGGNQPTPEQVLGGLYPDPDAARRHFAEEPEHLGGAGSDPAPIDLTKAAPHGLGIFAQAVTDHLEIPAEASVFMSIAALSTAAVGRYLIDGSSGGAKSWLEPLIVWMACGLLPGERKSDLVRIVSGPLRLAEQAGIEGHRLTMREANARRDILEARIHDLKQQLVRSKDPGKRTALEADLQDELKLLEELPDKDAAPPRILLEDVTAEALVERLTENHEALGVLTAEGGLMQIIAGRYGEVNFEVHLKCFGEEYYASDRVGRGSTILNHPALAMGLCVQPDVIERVAEIPSARELGFLGRWWYSIPRSLLGHRKNLRLPLGYEYTDWWAYILNQIRLVPPRQKDVPTLQLSPGADQQLQQLLNGIEPHLEPVVGRYSHMSDWASKLSGKTLRLAGLYHLSQDLNHHTQVSEETMVQAIEFSRWSTREAERLYQSWQREQLTDGVTQILAWVRRKTPETFSATDLKNSLRRAPWYTPDTRDRALVDLHNARWIASVKQYDASGRSRPTGAFVPHPSLLRGRR